MLESPILKFAVSTTLLQSRRVDPKKALAAGAAAAVIPGALGLVVPLVLVAQQAAPGKGQGAGGVLAEVPDVVGRSQEEAEQALERLELEPVSQLHRIAGEEHYDKGTVVQQVPAAKTLVKPGATVRLIVSAGGPDEGQGHKRLERPAIA
jgi:hypothetical protein